MKIRNGRLMFKLPRLAIFMEHENIWQILLEKQLRINYEDLKNFIAENHCLIAAIAYLRLPQQLTKKKISFLKSLTGAGWSFVFRPLNKNLNGKSSQKNYYWPSGW